MASRYPSRLFKKAFSDTVDFFGWNLRSLAVPILGALGMTARWVISGWQVVSGDVTATLFYAAGPIGIFAVCLFIYNLVRAPDRLQTECEARAASLEQSLNKIRNKQDKVDHLSGLLGEGIREIWNRGVTSETQLDNLMKFWSDWQARVSSYLGQNFNKADVDHFARLGVVPLVGRQDAYGHEQGDDRHAKLLREYALKESRLREIIRDHNVTHI